MESIPSLREVTTINIFELVGKLSLTGASKVSGNLTELEKKTQKLQNRMKMLGAAFTAVGVAGLKMVDSARKVNAELGVTAITFGITTKEMRGMVLETANVTFSIDEVVKTFDMLARAGVENEEVLKSTATAFDTLGDALNMSASQVTDIMVPAMKTFRLSAEEAAGKTDLMTYMVRNSTISLEDFNTMVGYTSQEMVGAGLTIEDMAAAMMYMSDSGVEPGKVMLREWNKAVTKSQDENIALTEALGMTTEELERYKTGLEGATGLTQQYADEANKQYGIMDKLRFMWSKITLQLGSALTPLEPVFALMTAMGPVMIFLSTSVGRSTLAWFAHAGAVMRSHLASVAHIGSSATLATTQNIAAGATVKATVAQHGLNRAMLANPILAIIAGIAALVAGIIYMWNNWERVTISMNKTWLRMKNLVAGGLPTYRAQMDALELEEKWQALAKSVRDSQEQMTSDVERASEQAISSAERVATEEKKILDNRSKYYRELTAERLGLIDEQMMAELAAMDPTGEVAKLAAEYNKTLGDMKEEGAERDREIEEDRVNALEEELRSGEELSRADKRRVEDQIADYEEGWRRQELENELHLAIMELDSDGFFEGQKTEIDTQLDKQVKAYQEELKAFKQLNADKLADLRGYINAYNSIMESAGLKPSGLLVPTGLVPRERERPSVKSVFEGLTLMPDELSKLWSGITERWQHGGMITEPTWLVRARDMKPYAIAGEAGPEPVGPAISGGDTYNISFPGAVVREELDIAKIGQMVSDELSLLQNRKDRRIGVRRG